MSLTSKPGRSIVGEKSDSKIDISKPYNPDSVKTSLESSKSHKDQLHRGKDIPGYVNTAHEHIETLTFIQQLLPTVKENVCQACVMIEGIPLLKIAMTSVH